jgi:hypothetical protein
MFLSLEGVDIRRPVGGAGLLPIGLLVRVEGAQGALLVKGSTSRVGSYAIDNTLVFSL